MEVVVVLTIMIEFIAFVHCLDKKEYDFTILHNKRGLAEVISIFDVTSVIQCAIHCSSIEGCNHANFRNSTKCELLHGILGEDMDMADETNSKFICMYIVVPYHTNLIFSINVYLWFHLNCGFKINFVVSFKLWFQDKF